MQSELEDVKIKFRSQSSPINSMALKKFDASV